MPIKKDYASKEFKIMTTLGDSVTAGGWAPSREGCWANKLTRLINEFQRVPVTLINVGVGANVISPRSKPYEYSCRPSALERVKRDVLNYTANFNNLRPDLLIIALGLNDARGGTPKEIFVEELKKLIDIVREEIDPLIVLVGPYYMYNYDLDGENWAYANFDTLCEYNEAIKEFAIDNNCLFADVLNSFNKANHLMHKDGVHPNNLGHQVIANKIFEVISTNTTALSLESKYLQDHIEPWRDETILDNR